MSKLLLNSSLIGSPIHRLVLISMHDVSLSYVYYTVLCVTNRSSSIAHQLSDHRVSMI